MSTSLEMKHINASQTINAREGNHISKMLRVLINALIQMVISEEPLKNG